VKDETFPLTIALDEITEELEVMLGRRVMQLYTDLVQVGEIVHDTRNFKESFVAPQKLEQYKWRIRNTADYAVVLAQGRHTVNGKAYGSLKWYHGLDPMLKMLELGLTTQFDKVER